MEIRFIDLNRALNLLRMTQFNDKESEVMTLQRPPPDNLVTIAIFSKVLVGMRTTEEGLLYDLRAKDFVLEPPIVFLTILNCYIKYKSI